MDDYAWRLLKNIVEKELAKLLSSKNEKSFVSKEILSNKIIELYAREDRAKRIAMFYGSSLLSVQYFINSFIKLFINFPRVIKSFQ